MSVPHLFLIFFSPKILGKLWTGISGLGLILVVDTLITIKLAQYIGGFGAVGTGGSLGILGALLMTRKTRQIYFMILREIKLGNFNPSLLTWYLGSLCLICLMALPGLFSTSLALLFYPPIMSKFLGRFLIGSHTPTLLHIHQHLSG